jgi:Dolichyl-phosphate-mannose-protein mannosyltransferase
MFEKDAQHMAALLRKHQYLILLVLTIIYAAGAMGHARNKPIWYDEVVTVIAANAPDVATAWKQGQTMDANPPLLHVMTHLAMRWFGNSEVAIRVPAIVGFWVFCLCMYRFTLRRVGIFYAMLALLLPIATEAYGYSYEARAYGLELAFCGLALVAWQMVAEGSKHLLACVLLTISLVCAVLSHYYAILVYLPLAGGELYRSWRRRRIDWPVWLAFAAGGIPVLFRVAFISRVVDNFKHPSWSPAYPEQVLEFWETALQHTLSFLVLGVAVLALWMMRSSKSANAPEDAGSPPELVDHELLAGALFLAIPICAVLAGMIVTHMFTGRYALLAITGVAILAPMIIARLANGRAFPGFLLFVLSLLPLFFVTLEIPPPRHPWEDEPVLVKALEKGPVVLTDGQMFLQMWYYAPEKYKSNVLFVADSVQAIKYTGHDSFDFGIRGLQPYSSIHFIPFSDFAQPGREFLLYENPLKPGWVLPKVVADGGSAELIELANYRQLYRMRFKP